MNNIFNKLYLIRNPEVFQKANKLENIYNYFEGWYFKNTTDNYGISIIPGINIKNNKKHCFIQIITQKDSYYINYNFNDFKFNNFPFYIQIKNNFFSKDKVHLDIIDKNIKINGDLNYYNIHEIENNLFSPNIMGPFSYLPFMECNHAILSMKHYISGNITINDKPIYFDNGIRIYRKRLGNFIS